MKSSVARVNKLSWLIVIACSVWSCQKENVGQETPEKIQMQTKMAAADNSQIVATTQDVMDVTAGAFAGQGLTGGRYSSYGNKMGNPDLDCAPSVTGSFTFDRTVDSLVYKGTITIDYGSGSSCKDSTEIRKGKIIDAFAFIKRLIPKPSFSLMESLTFQGFQKDSVKLDGAFSSKTSSSDSSILEIKDAKITYSNGSSVSWSGSFTITHGQGKAVDDDGDGDAAFKKVSGSISGVTRSGAAFSATITKKILFEYACSRNMPVSGTIDIKVGTVESTVDYGDGTCDKTYTITTGGKTTEYTFKRHNKD